MKHVSGLKKSALCRVVFLIHRVSQRGLGVRAGVWQQDGELRKGAGGEEGRKEDSASDNHGRPRKETKEGHGKQERGWGGGSPTEEGP